MLQFFFVSEISFVLFKSSFCTESVNISLAISCLFLEIPKLLNFSFFFLSDTSFHFLAFQFGLLFLLDVLENCLLFFFFPEFLFLFHRQSHTVGMFNFHHHDFHFFSLCSRYFEFFFLHLFYLLFQNLSFSVYYFSCFLPN